MRYYEIASGFRLPVSSEEQEFLNKTSGGLPKDELDEREEELARLMVSRGVLDHYMKDNRIFYRPIPQQIFGETEMVDRSEVNQMAKYMAALKGDSGLGSTAGYDLAEGVAPAPRMVGDAGVAEMKAILERFHNAADNVLSEVPIDRSLRESLRMAPTPHGARMGSWEIVVHQTGKRKLYDVVHIATQETIAADLMLYEAACGLARQLNEGGHINSKIVVELLRAEQSYAGAVHDMVLYKHHLTKSPNSPRRPIYEDRYGAAKRQAVAFRDQVKKLSESL